MHQLLVYSDEGVSPRALRELIKSLRQLDGVEIIKVNRHNLFDLFDQLTPSLFIMPGGRDTPYHNALTGAKCAKIRDFVQNGGAYLGLCAGGYFGAATLEFELGFPLEVSGVRELKFFPGKAEGAALGKGLFRYDSEEGSCITTITVTDGPIAGNKVAVYYNGGCSFVNPEEYPNCRVLATYENSKAAIISCNVGKGRAILSGVHPEYELSKESPLFTYLIRYALIP